MRVRSDCFFLNSLQKPVNSLLYSRGLALRLHALVFRKEENARILKECGKFDFESLMSSFSIYAIDDNFSKHMYGIKDVIEYYKESSVSPRSFANVTRLSFLII